MFQIHLACEVKKRHMHTGAHFHDIFKEGCRIVRALHLCRCV